MRGHVGRLGCARVWHARRRGRRFGGWGCLTLLGEAVLLPGEEAVDRLADLHVGSSGSVRACSASRPRRTRRTSGSCCAAEVDRASPVIGQGYGSADFPRRVQRAAPVDRRPVPSDLSPRLAAVVEALPLTPEARVLEIGCGPGGAARAVAARLETGHILAIDRSPAAIRQAAAAGVDLIAGGQLRVRQVAAEDFVLLPDDEPFDVVFAVRVGALDGRHPRQGEQVPRRLAAATVQQARLLIDGGDPLREIPIPRTLGR